MLNPMKLDQRLWRVLHVLLHMNETSHAMTSQEIAQMLDTNPVVVRRIMAGLREQDYVKSEKGHGGGWSLLCSLEQITLLDVYQALGKPAIFALGPAEAKPKCLIEQAVNHAIDDVLKQSENLLLERFQKITVAQINSDFENLFAELPAKARLHKHHRPLQSK